MNDRKGDLRKGVALPHEAEMDKRRVLQTGQRGISGAGSGRLARAKRLQGGQTARESIIVDSVPMSAIQDK